MCWVSLFEDNLVEFVFEKGIEEMEVDNFDCEIKSFKIEVLFKIL